MTVFAALPIGTTIIARVDHGPIIEGQPGIIAGPPLRSRIAWWRRAYVCTFLGGIRVTIQGRRIKTHDHGFGCRMLEHPCWFLHTRDGLLTRDKSGAEPGRFKFSPE